MAELLVVLTIVSILALMAIPFAETAARRDSEAKLQETLRTVRRAIDSFHDDWKAGIMPAASDAASRNGYPRSLQVLVDGVDISEGEVRFRRYLRALPRNPFSKGEELEEQWRLVGYVDQPDAEIWNGEDVYDLRPRTDREALDGTQIGDW